MLRIESSGLTQSLASATQRRGQPAGDLSEALSGVRVTLSELGRSKASRKNQDIDDSSLPDALKASLKLIRHLREQIAEKQRELQALMRSRELDDETRLQRAAELQGMLDSLNSALLGAMANLAEAVRKAGLNGGQAAELTRLLG